MNNATTPAAASPALKLATAIAALTGRNGPAPYFRTMLSLTVAKVETTEIPTLAVSHDWRLHWNPQYVAQTPLQELVWGLYHECWHLRSKHHERSVKLGLVKIDGTLVAPELQARFKAANIAQDASINEQIRKIAGTKLPATWVFPETLPNFGFEAQPLNLTWEERFARLKPIQPPQDKKQGKGKGKGAGGGADKGDNKGESDGEGEGEGEGAQSADQGTQGQDSSDQGAQGGSAGTAGDDAGAEGQGKGQGKGQGDGADQGGPGSGNCGSCSCGGSPTTGEGRSEAEIERALRETAEAVRRHAAAKGAGSVPGDLLRWAEETLQPAKVDWRDVVSAACRHAIASRPGAVDLSFRHRSRRQAGVGFGLGAPVVPGLHRPIPRVAVIVDTSGSMGAADLQEAAQEVNGVFEAVQAEVTIVAVDATVRAAAECTTIEQAIAQFRGGGGTNMLPGFQYLERQTNRPEVIVVITDGYFPEPVPFIEWANVVWVLTGANPGPGADWGETVILKAA